MAHSYLPLRPVPTPMLENRRKSPAEAEFERLAKACPNMPATEAGRRIRDAGLSWMVPE